MSVRANHSKNKQSGTWQQTNDDLHMYECVNIQIFTRESKRRQRAGEHQTISVRAGNHRSREDRCKKERTAGATRQIRRPATGKEKRRRGKGGLNVWKLTCVNNGLCGFGDPRQGLSCGARSREGGTPQSVQF